MKFKILTNQNTTCDIHSNHLNFFNITLLEYSNLNIRNNDNSNLNIRNIDIHSNHLENLNIQI